MLRKVEFTRDARDLSAMASESCKKNHFKKRYGRFHKFIGGDSSPPAAIVELEDGKIEIVSINLMRFIEEEPTRTVIGGNK